VDCGYLEESNRSLCYPRLSFARIICSQSYSDITK